MATIKVESGFGFGTDLLSLNPIDILTGSIDVSNSSQFQFTYRNGDSLRFEGNFTDFDEIGPFTIPTEGTVRTIVVSKKGDTAITVTGVSVSVDAVVDAVESESLTAGLALLNSTLGGKDDFKGGGKTDTFKGFGGADSIVGNSGADFLFGDAGDDKLYAGAKEGRGSDRKIDALTGGKGNDTFFVDNAGDKVFEKVGEGKNDTVQAHTNYTLNAGAEVEFIFARDAGAKSALKLTGNDFAQQISGNAGNNIINGKGGSDYLRGERQGAESNGRDIFVFDTKLNDNAADLNKRNVDKMNEFQPGEDKIALDNKVFTKLTEDGALSLGENAQGLGEEFFKDLRDVRASSTDDIVLDGNDHILYDVVRGLGTLYYDADGSGAGRAVAFAQLLNASSIDLSNSDFIVI